MNPKEVVETLLVEAKIEPGFTELGNNFCSVFFFPTHMHAYIRTTTQFIPDLFLLSWSWFSTCKFVVQH